MRAVERLYALHHSRAAVDQHVGAHAVEVARVREAVLKHVLHHHRGSLGHGGQRQHLGLHIGGKARMRLRLQLLESREPLRRAQPRRAFLLVDLAAHLPQLGKDSVQVSAGYVGQPDVAARGRRRGQQGTGHNAVRHGLIAYAMQALHALDGHGMRACAADARAHGVEQVLQIADLRLPRHVAQHRAAPEQHRGHHHVFGGPHAGIVKMHGTGAHMPAVAANEAAFLPHVHPQLPQSAQMQVDGPQTDLASAGKGDRGLAKPRQDGPQ